METTIITACAGLQVVSSALKAVQHTELNKKLTQLEAAVSSGHQPRDVTQRISQGGGISV